MVVWQGESQRTWRLGAELVWLMELDYMGDHRQFGGKSREGDAKTSGINHVNPTDREALESSG